MGAARAASPATSTSDSALRTLHRTGGTRPHERHAMSVTTELVHDIRARLAQLEDALAQRTQDFEEQCLATSEANVAREAAEDKLNQVVRLVRDRLGVDVLEFVACDGITAMAYEITRALTPRATDTHQADVPLDRYAPKATT